MVALFIIIFILVYSLLVFLFASKTKIKGNNNEKINLIKNNSIISDDIKKDFNKTNKNINETKIINENNRTNITDIKGNNTTRQS